jgi:hypothetical protein
MKKLFTLLLLSFICNFFAQKIKQGNYISNKQGNYMKFKVMPDNTYEMIFLYGKIEENNDTINLSQQFKNKTNFQVDKVVLGNSGNVLKLNFSAKDLQYYNEYINIETSNNDDNSFNGKKLSDLIKEKYGDDEKSIEENITENNEMITVELPLNAYLKLVFNEGEKSSLVVFDIPKKTAEMEIVFASYPSGFLNLKAYKNEKQEIVVTDGILPILFKFDEETTDQKQIITESKIHKIKMKDVYESAVMASDSTETGYSYRDDAYKFIAKTEKSIKEGLANIKNDTIKNLVIYYDEDEANGKKAFDQLLEQYNYSISDAMYEGYKPESDLYNFYLAKKSDKKALEKLGVKKFPAVVVVDNKNNFLFKREYDLANDTYLFNSYSEVNTKIQEAKKTIKINSELNDKKAKREKIVAVFTEISKLTTNTNYTEAVVESAYYTPPPAEVTPSAATNFECV